MPRLQWVAGNCLDIITRGAVEQGKLLLQTDHVLGILAHIYRSTIASQAGAYAFLDFAIGRLHVVGQRKDFLIEDVQEVDEDYAYPNDILCAVNVVEGVQLLRNTRLAFNAIIIAIAARVLASLATSR